MNRALRQAIASLRKAKRTSNALAIMLCIDDALRLLSPPQAAPKKLSQSPKLPKLLQNSKSERKQKHRLSTKEIREVCMARANGRCECGCGRWFDNLMPGRRPEMDEWLGGSGRKQQRKSFRTCWMLVDYCHRQRTANVPNAAYWNEKFRKHCDMHGYYFHPHIEHAQLPRSA